MNFEQFSECTDVIVRGMMMAVDKELSKEDILMAAPILMATIGSMLGLKPTEE